MSTRITLIVCFFVSSSAAVDITDFSNNLASDLGPLLSLFGDSMTKQFLGESITFLDYVIFAVAPIGIITALVSTIRLCGSTALRAFVGRSQEGQGAVEAELCTSTSRDVCELFTRGGIQRVLGRPSILELVYLPHNENSEKSSNGTLKHHPQLLLSKDYFTKHARLADSPWKEMKSAYFGQEAKSRIPVLAPNPNLSLNIGIRRPPNWVLSIIAIIGLFLQTGVLALAGVGVWRLGWDLSEGGGPAARDYAPIMFIVGTALLCAGMWGCAFLIGQTTQEVRFQRKTDRGPGAQPRLLWIQPGPQVIGDQSFDPFAYLEDKNTINTWSSSRKIMDKRFELYTYAAVLATLVGYIMQFIGIRGMEAWVSLAQLAVTIIMSLLRGALRTQRLGNDDNQLRAMPDMVAGHELDWLAYRLVSRDEFPEWHVTAQYRRGTESEENIQDESTSALSAPTSTDEIVSAVPASAFRVDTNPVSLPNDAAHGFIDIRRRLANLTGLSASGTAENGTIQTWKDEHVKVRAKARQLSSVFASTLLARVAIRRAKDITLYVGATTLNGPTKGMQPIGLTLRAPHEFSQVGWRLDAAHLEAVIGLWMWTILKDRMAYDSDEVLRPGEVTNSAIERSIADQIPAARIVSFGLDNTEWHTSIDLQEEMDLWLGRSSVKFRQSTIVIDQQHLHGLATTFYKEKEEGSLRKVFSRNDDRFVVMNMQRFCGWTLAHQAIDAAWEKSTSHGSRSPTPNTKAHLFLKFRFQHAQLSSSSISLLDLCCQELFIAMMMSLIEFKAETMGHATFVESGNTLRLEHPVVSTFADAFVEAGLGTYPDALLCIIPALRSKLPSLSPETILPALITAAESYRRDSQWKRAETILRFGCTRSHQPGIPPEQLTQALRALCELYRWALSMFTVTERTFGLEGIEWVSGTYAEACKTNAQAKVIVDCYIEVARRFKSVDADEGHVLEETRGKNVATKAFRKSTIGAPQPARLQALQKQLLLAIGAADRTEALFQLSVITRGCEHASAIPTSALALAAQNDWVEVVSALLQLNASPNDSDADGKRAVYHCVERGHEACAQVLLDHHASIESSTSSNGSRLMLLHMAIRKKHVGIVKLLLNNGFVEIDQLDDSSCTPLEVASEIVDTEILNILLNRFGATIAQKGLGPGALALASRKGHVNVIQLLLDALELDLERGYEQNQTPLWLAVYHGNEEAATLLLERGANVETEGKHGSSPLSMAVGLHYIPLVRILLENGAEVDKKDCHQKTLLMDSVLKLGDPPRREDDPVRQRQIKVIDLLLRYGADLEIKDKNGMSLLAHVASQINTTSLQVMLAHGADTESRDNKGRTPLMQAVRSRARDATLILLDAGAKIEGKDEEGNTVLFYAGDNGNILQTLIDRGANLEARNNQGETALLVAQKQKNVGLMNLLLENGADGEVLGLEGLTVRAWLRALDNKGSALG